MMTSDVRIPHLIQEMEERIDGFLKDGKTFRNMGMSAYREPVIDPSRQLADRGVFAFFYLANYPFSSAQKVSEAGNIDKSSIKAIYRAISQSLKLQKYLRESMNGDYFRIVDHHFNHRLFTIVFFVGTSCPNRCIFCPNVRIGKNGERSLIPYKNDGNRLLTKGSYEEIFSELDILKEENETAIMVKISGGLEPLTDMDRTDHILELSLRKGYHVKIFTNGTLLDTPERRRICLKAGDIRVSLSTSDSKRYEWIAFGERKNGTPLFTLEMLKKNLRDLLKERNDRGLSASVGLNVIVMPSNCDDMISLVQMASEMGLDYVDFKPEYFERLNDMQSAGIEEKLDRVKNCLVDNRYGRVYVKVADSLYRDNLYWCHRNSECDILKQSLFKIFITPHGHLSPVHYGAFPLPSYAGEKKNYTIGKIENRKGIIHILKYPESTLSLPTKMLNPFELMLYLETRRREEDFSWGLRKEDDPYLFHSSDR